MRQIIKFVGTLICCNIIATFGVAQEKGEGDKGKTRSLPSFFVGNREEPTETQQLVIAKSFCVEMRRQHDCEDVSNLRGYFDPRYLEQHDLLKGDFRVQMAPVGAIHNIQLADDKQTLLCYLETGNGQKESILLRTVTHAGRLYLLPLKSPAEDSKVVTPWILRMKL